MTAQRPSTVLYADDDEDDRLFLREALEASDVPYQLHTVNDGEEAMEYLQHRGRYLKPETAPRPAVILLDLNMPKMGGREAIRAIKADPDLHAIPIVVLTTSRAANDIARSYELGASSYIVKPSTFQGLLDVVRTIRRTWLEN